MNTQIERKHIEIDAADQAVGRVATQVAMILRGKNKPSFDPSLDTGDFVTVINASKVKFTGLKFVQKDYYSHSMHPGGISRIPMAWIFKKDPTDVIRRAVNKMLPKNKMRGELLKRLTVKP